MQTKIINLFTGPGVGKSTTAAGVFYEMKRAGYSVELIDEYAKQMTWEGRQGEMSNQIYIFAKQVKKLERLRGKVDWVVCDSPFLIGASYATKGYYKNFVPLLKEVWDDFDNYNYYLNREFAYQQVGRNQNEQGARKMDRKILRLLKTHGVPYTRVNASVAVAEILGDVETIQNKIQKTLDRKKKR